MVIVWTQGHSEVEGNDIAGRLTKEGACKAKKIDETSSNHPRHQTARKNQH